MKTALVLCALLAILAGIAQATEPDTTLVPLRGTLFVYGKGPFAGKDCRFIIRDRKLILQPPGRLELILQELPDPDAPHPLVPDKIMKRYDFSQELANAIQRLQQSDPALMRSSLDSLCAAFAIADSVVPYNKNTFLIYWTDEKGFEVLTVEDQGPPNPDQLRTTNASIRRGLVVMTKAIIRILNEDTLVFFVSQERLLTQPRMLVFRDMQKIYALMDVITILQGGTDLRVLKGRVVDELICPTY